jgi:large subunit ribosomal protein L5
MEKTRLERLYLDKISPLIKSELGLSNVMETPRLLKIVINIGVKEAIQDSKALDVAKDILKKITGRQPISRKASKSIASFKLREGMPIGASVTLRRAAMYEFLDRLINLSLPRIRDFQGVNRKFDGRGSYNLGIKDSLIFPEIDFGVGQKVSGLNITIQTSAKRDDHGLMLLEKFGMPFKKSE